VRTQRQSGRALILIVAPYQYCGQLGKQDNCQVAVSLSLASERASLPIAFRLYLPEEWVADKARREKAGVPADIDFATKPQIALEQIRAAKAAGVPAGVVLADSGYGNSIAFRESLSGLELKYCVGVQPSTTVWTAERAPLPPKIRKSGRGRPATRLRRARGHEPFSVKKLAFQLPRGAWRRLTWRQGSNAPLRSRFAALRVRAAHQDWRRSELREEQWLLIDWPESESEPVHYWLCTLPANLSITHNNCADRSAQSDVGEARQSTPHDGISGRRIAGTCKIAAEPSDLDQVVG
jgi:SRSO17 transposase